MTNDRTSSTHPIRSRSWHWGATPDPNVLGPGDQVRVIDKIVDVEPAATGSTHTYVLNRLGASLRLELDVFASFYRLEVDGALRGEARSRPPGSSSTPSKEMRKAASCFCGPARSSTRSQPSRGACPWAPSIRSTRPIDRG